MLKNESSYKSVVKAFNKVIALESSKIAYFCHETECHPNICSILNGLINLQTCDYAIKVMIFSHSNDKNSRKSKRFLVLFNRFFGFFMNPVHTI